MANRARRPEVALSCTLRDRGCESGFAEMLNTASRCPAPVARLNEEMPIVRIAPAFIDVN